MAALYDWETIRAEYEAEAQRVIKIPLSDREKAIVERLGRNHGGAV